MCALLSAVFAMQPSGGSRSYNYHAPHNTRISGLSRFLSTFGRGSAFRRPVLDDPDEEEDGEDDDDDEYDGDYYPSSAPWKGPEISEPQQEGVELLNSGDFGRVGSKARTRRNYINVANLILNRSRNARPTSNREDYVAVRIYL